MDEDLDKMTREQFLRGCLQYRESLDEQLPDAPRSRTPSTPRGDA